MDIRTKKVLDNRIYSSDVAPYDVRLGGSSVSCLEDSSTTFSRTQITHNVNVSSKTFINSNPMMKVDMVFLLTGKTSSTNNVETNLIDYGTLDALRSLPLNHTIKSLTITYNNHTIAVDYEAVLPTLLRCMDKDELYKYQTGCPVMMDSCYEYGDLTDTKSNPLAGYGEIGYDNDIVPRGAFNVTISQYGSVPMSSDQPNTELAALVSFTTHEPLLCASPLTYGPDHPSLYNLQAFKLNLILNNGNKGWTCAKKTNLATRNCVLNEIKGSTLLFTSISPPTSMIVPSKNVIPYKDYMLYSQNYQGKNLASKAELRLPSPAYTLSVVPRAVAISVVDPKLLDGTFTGRPDSFLKIKGINIKYNNQTGLLSGFTPNQLYRISSENGVNMSQQEWNGSVMKSGNSSSIPLIGSVLLLQFGKDIQLKDTEAPGTAGRYDFSFSLDIENQSNSPIPDLQLNVLCIYDGILTTENDRTEATVGVLTNNDVVDTWDKKDEITFEQNVVAGNSKSFKQMTGLKSSRFK
jgi:hypothetical protein